jgi:hypothetical protein
MRTTYCRLDVEDKFNSEKFGVATITVRFWRYGPCQLKVFGGIREKCKGWS